MAAPPHREARLTRGLRLGKYRLDCRLGEGAFSQVWKAKDQVEDRWVALKLPQVVRAGSAEEEELLEEIRLSAWLDHDNILSVRNADKIDGRFVIATDLAEESLDDRLTRRLSVRRSLHYMRQILQGLAHAHQHRVIHRDLKPSNLMIFADDCIRIADFGLAKVAKHTMISATGSGTLLYVAPEQAHGYPCFASDVFSLGLIFHQMLAGELPRWPFRWPFEGHGVLRSKVTRELLEITRKATDPDHRQRYRDASEMLRAFETALPGMERHIRRQLRKKKQRVRTRRASTGRKRRRPTRGRRR